MSKARFLELLAENRIQTVVDVRRWPTSKLNHFKRESLEDWLRAAGIQYLWLGKELGGYRSGGYEAYTQTEAFKAGIEKLLPLIRMRNVCILCLEPDPRYCHRRFLAAYLSGLGVEVVHIPRRGRKQPHMGPTSKRKT